MLYNDIIIHFYSEYPYERIIDKRYIQYPVIRNKNNKNEFNSIFTNINNSLQINYLENYLMFPKILITDKLNRKLPIIILWDDIIFNKNLIKNIKNNEHNITYKYINNIF